MKKSLAYSSFQQIASLTQVAQSYKEIRNKEGAIAPHRDKLFS